MKKLLALFLLSILVLGLIGCNKPIEEPNEDIYKAKDYAMSIFEDTMPEDCVIVHSTASIGEHSDDSIYIIKFTYTIGDDDKHLYYTYKVSVEGANFTIVEESDE